MRAVSDSHNYRAHEEVARELEKRFGHPHVQGAHAERDGVERPDRSPSRSELRQEERTGIRGSEVKAEITALFRASDNAEGFKAALENKGYLLAQGDRRDFVLVDRAGGVHSLARRIENVKAAQLREFMKPIDRSRLPNVEQARTAQSDRQEGRLSLLDQRDWDERLARSAIAKEKSDIEKAKRIRAGKREADKKNKTARGYSKGADYVSQTQAALKHDKKLRKQAEATPRPRRPATGMTIYERMRAERDLQQAPPAMDHRPSAYERLKEKLASKEMTDGKSARLERSIARQLNRASSSDRRDDDRQMEAPGDGRTRSR